MPLLADNVRNLYASLVVVALVITGLVLGKDILIPLAVATLVAFILNPIVIRLMRWRLPEALAVAIVLSGVIALTIVMSTVLSSQMLSLTGELQTYRQNLVEKVRYLSAFGKGDGAIKRASDAVENLGAAIEREIKPGRGPTASPSEPGTTTAHVGTQPQPPVAAPSPLAGRPAASDDGALSVLKILGEPLAKVALTLLFTLFLLLQHQDLRDRIVRIAGTDNLSGTTAAMSDAGTRLSSLFLAQAMLNAGFGVFVGVALAVIGVPNPILWGVVTAIMRFVPFIGSFIAAVPPIILAAAVDPGWSMALATLMLFVVGDPVMGHMIEPQVLGKKAGLSPFAMVVSASLWTVIWGPIGLVLAAPLTMLLVVLGRYIPGLEVVSVLFGDERALNAEQELYGRLLAGDSPAAVAQITDAIDGSSVVAASHAMLLPALQLAATDIRRGRLDPDRVAQARDTIRDVIDVISDAVPDTPTGTEQRQRPLALIVPARGPIDTLAAEIVLAAMTAQGVVSGKLATGMAGLSALAHERDDAGAKRYDAIVITTVGGIDSRHLSIMARRAERDFPGTRVMTLDYGSSALVPGSAPNSEPSMHYDSLVNIVSALDFTPSRPAKMEPGTIDSALALPAIAS